MTDLGVLWAEARAGPHGAELGTDLSASCLQHLGPLQSKFQEAPRSET